MKPVIQFLAFFFACGTVTAQQPNGTNVLSAPGGRYVFGQVGPARADQYMLDTATGRLWRIVETTSKATVLQPIDYLLLDRKRSLVPFDADTETGLLEGDREEKPRHP